MDIHSNLEYLCRVCAANTNGKNSVPECVHILKTPGLRDKLDKFLYLKIFENDALPKVLCKSCFRQVEATASLSKIAKHTQEVFRDFLLSNLPKGPPETTRKSAEKKTTPVINSKPADNNDKHKNGELIAANKSLPQLPTAVLIPAQLKPVLPTLPTRKDEVVVNVSVSDPLTRDNQQKMISNSQRRQSLLIDSRYTPKSIAQKTSASVQKLVTPTTTAEDNANTTANNQKSLAPTLNYFPLKNPPQHQTGKQLLPTSTQITTFSSGGYVIGRPTPITNNINEHQELKKIHLPLASAADNVLQKKRKNLAKALNNIKSNNTGQVSLLKSSQNKQPGAPTSQNAHKTPITEVVNQTVDNELPEKIIIAAPKNKLFEKPKGKEPLNLSGKQQVIPSIPAIPQMPTTTATITPVIPQPDQQQPPFSVAPFKPGFPDDILLGRVIRDMDLLKLILKALKWPVNKQNSELQLERLKNSKFTDIMSDANLLQDTDLTQLLGPYLAPVLLATQVLQHQQQQQQLYKNAEIQRNQQNMAAAFLAQVQAQARKPITALELAQAEINKSIPYKLPPETSVQLVPATPEETDEATTSPPLASLSSSNTLKKRDRQKDKPVTKQSPPKRQRREAAQRARTSIVISDEDDEESEDDVMPKVKQRSAKTAPNIHIELSPNFISQCGFLNGSFASARNNATASLLALVEKTALVEKKMLQRRRRNSVSSFVTLPPSEFDALIDLDDDIVLMEPVTTTSSMETTANPSNKESTAMQKIDAANTFLTPSIPLITRPIIKRRKTVIHSSKGRYDLSIDMKEKDQDPILTSSVSPTKEKQTKETNIQVPTNTTNQAIVVTSDIKESPTQNANTEALLKNSPAIDTAPAKVAPQKKLQSKAALGQQLLEAIGLQKISSKMNSNGQQTEAATSSSSTEPNAENPAEKIRSALKKSLKQAQDQRELKKKELSNSETNTIIQDADSTTKSSSSVLKQIVVVEGKGNSTDNCSSLVDVEEQIDKVTLMVRNNENDTNEKSSTTNASNERADKKELKKLPTTKVQEKRRTLLAATNGENDCNVVGRKVVEANDSDEKPTEDKANDKENVQQDADDKTENEKTEKMESEIHLNISSSSTSETNVAEKEEPAAASATPKKRGRKRILEKQNDTESSSATDEKDTKSTATITIIKDDETETSSGGGDGAVIKKDVEDSISNRTPSRPTRQSKTLSKYYKGPDKQPVPSRRFLPSRTTRNR